MTPAIVAAAAAIIVVAHNATKVNNHFTMLALA
jgi:hypothetical protein